MFRPQKKSAIKSSTKMVTTSQKYQGPCEFSHRKCSLQSLENYGYCMKHILEDKNAPYKPCSFLYTTCGKRCSRPTYCPDRKDTCFCPEHSRRAQAAREKACAKHPPPQTVDTLLASLGHYAKGAPGESGPSDSSFVNPFADVNAAEVNARVGTRVLDFASDSEGDSDAEAATLGTVWRAQDLESSDADSVDSQDNDPLKHAEVYTAEEVTTITKDKMVRLQSLYIDQLRRLHHLLRERRRKYLHGMKKETETLCRIHDQDKSNPKEIKMYKKLKALNGYHRYYGQEAILHRKSLDRRAALTERVGLPRSYNKGKCIFTEGGVKCGTKSLPSSRHCRKHIMEDSQQVLFRVCGATRGDHSHSCHEPVLDVFENATCVYHTPLPPIPLTPLASQPPPPTMANETASTEEESEREEKVGVRDSLAEELPEASALLSSLLGGADGCSAAQAARQLLTEEADKLLSDEAGKLALADVASAKEGDGSTDMASEAPDDSVEVFVPEETSTAALERLAEAADMTSRLPILPVPDYESIEELIPATTIAKPQPPKAQEKRPEETSVVKPEASDEAVMMDMSEVEVEEEILEEKTAEVTAVDSMEVNDE